MATAAYPDPTKFDLKPFKIDISSKVSHLKTLVRNTRLPAKPLYPDLGADKGIQLDFLSSLKEEWVTSYDWDAEQATLNEFKHFTAVIEGLTVHFIHEKSADADAIPVILLHGWPASFHEFTPVIKPLTQSSTNAAGKKASFNVVVPSLPGFVFSSLPPVNWTTDDTARIFNTLMTDVLGYPKYAVHATDWGCIMGYSLYSNFATTVRAAQFDFIPFSPPSREEMAAENITLTPEQNVTVARCTTARTTGLGFRDMQTNKPNDVGLSLYDNPVGQLAWMGGKIKLWSDPRAGMPPSQLNSTAILTLISLYYLTDSFLSSLWIYVANPEAFSSVYSNKASTDAPMLFSQYKYNVAYWPEEFVAKVGNLVSYTVHEFGGHFPGLDNPPAMIADIREVASYWKV
ncbi:Alpha/Beta hydrolase protein [Mycena albidolilacea]|uniref:Alpha/Beta hydrolase protein n=1 Tax=Mycena albidolilacea TaxID=1033008 RepID=A0AAD7A1A7_9AGAR|nr:Alpha/Beta hydrolase protein [Mycena albidolilacea]